MAYIDNIVYEFRDYYYLPPNLLYYTATILTLAAAASYGWTSPSLIKLTGPDSPIPITNDESSWIAAFMVLGTIVGPIPTAWSVDR